MRLLGVILIVVGLMGLVKSMQNMKDNPSLESLMGAIAPGAALIFIGSFWVFGKMLGSGASGASHKS